MSCRKLFTRLGDLYENRNELCGNLVQSMTRRLNAVILNGVLDFFNTIVISQIAPLKSLFEV
jgi:hypothetical protein